MVILEEIACLANFRVYLEFLRIRNTYPDHVDIFDVHEMFGKMPAEIKKHPEYEAFRKEVVTPFAKDVLKQIRRIKK